MLSRKHSTKRTVTSTLALAILQTACLPAPMHAQGGDYHPGDPIHLGSVHKPFQDDAPSVNVAPQPSSQDSSAQTNSTANGAGQPTQLQGGVGTRLLQGGVGTRLLQGGVGSHFLQGGVEHSEQLGPVQNPMKVGSTFDEAKLEKLDPMRIWYRVPPWLSGKWQFDEEIQTFYQDYKAGATYPQEKKFSRHQTSSWGFHRDRLGGLWDCIMVPVLTQVTSDEELWKDLHTDDSVIFDSDAKVITRYKYTRTAVDRTTNKVRGVFQIEQFASFFPHGPEALRAEFSIKSFDDRGNAISLTRTYKIGHKVGPVKLSDFDRNNQDVRPSFRQYLMSQSLENLVPLEQ
jgi:hypothetical protein